jgi:N-acetylmuramate 1-kinase
MLHNPVSCTWTFKIADESELRQVASSIAPLLKPGIPVALIGDLGAGKTAFARALLRLLSDDDLLEVPSPTFTILQEYDTGRGRVSHFDLYRLSGTDELEELGFLEALDETISLIEWPDRAGKLPGDRIDIEITMGADPGARQFTITGLGTCAGGLERLNNAQEFIDQAGWGVAARTMLHGDASTRAYELLDMDGKRAIFMNAPTRPDGPVIRDGQTYGDIAKLTVDLKAFCMVAKGLADKGFSSPGIHAKDIRHGFLLLEYYGTETIVDGEQREPVLERYQVAVDVLAGLHAMPWPVSVQDDDLGTYNVPAYDRAAMLIEVELILDWFLPAATGQEATDTQRSSFLNLWTNLMEFIEATPPVWVLRDYHSPNLHWLSERSGTARIGLIDFQDAVLGHPAYDLVSLLQDARVTVSADMEAGLLDRYLTDAGKDPAFDRPDFLRAYAILGAQRNTKILGIFVRLARRDGKPGYLEHLPRISRYLARDLAHPALADLARWYRENLPQAISATADMFGPESEAS